MEKTIWHLIIYFEVFMLITLVTYYCLNISERQKRIGDLYRDLIGHFYVIGGSDWRSLFWGSDPTLITRLSQPRFCVDRNKKFEMIRQVNNFLFTKHYHKFIPNPTITRNKSDPIIRFSLGSSKFDDSWNADQNWFSILKKLSITEGVKRALQIKF